MKSIFSLLITLTILLCGVNQSVAQSGETQMYIKYTKLVAERDALQTEIDNTTKVMATLKRAKAKKMGKQLAVLQQKYDAAIRSISAFPQSISDPNYKKDAQDRDTEEFRNEMSRKLQEKLSKMDMDAEATANIQDPELIRAYSHYKKQDERTPTEPTKNHQENIYFTVQIANGISGKIDQMRGIDGVHEVNMGYGKSYYCVGKFNDEFQADEQCKALRKKSNRYRDAFVTAFNGTIRISPIEAHRLRMEQNGN